MFVLQTERDSVVPGRTMPAVIPVSAEYRRELWKRLADDSASAGHFFFRGFSILMAHGVCIFDSAQAPSKLGIKELLLLTGDICLPVAISNITLLLSHNLTVKVVSVIVLRLPQ
jgi:hypothetical protein